MWKKTGSVTAILCAALLVGCNTDDEAVPSTNETPMEDVQEDTERLVPDVNTPSPNNGTNEGIYDNDTNQNLDDNINNNTDPKVNEDENLNMNGNGTGAGGVGGAGAAGTGGAGAGAGTGTGTGATNGGGM